MDTTSRRDLAVGRREAVDRDEERTVLLVPDDLMQRVGRYLPGFAAKSGHEAQRTSSRPGAVADHVAGDAIEPQQSFVAVGGVLESSPGCEVGVGQGIAGVIGGQTPKVGPATRIKKIDP